MGLYCGKALLKIAISINKCPYRFEILLLAVANAKFTGRKSLCEKILGYPVHKRFFTIRMPDIDIKPVRAYYNDFLNNLVPSSALWDLSKSGRRNNTHF